MIWDISRSAPIMEKLVVNSQGGYYNQTLLAYLFVIESKKALNADLTMYLIKAESQWPYVY
jgi:hypothetical protein